MTIAVILGKMTKKTSKQQFSVKFPMKQSSYTQLLHSLKSPCVIEAVKQYFVFIC